MPPVFFAKSEKKRNEVKFAQNCTKKFLRTPKQNSKLEHRQKTNFLCSKETKQDSREKKNFNAEK